jgi:hypothetical protein
MTTPAPFAFRRTKLNPISPRGTETGLLKQYEGVQIPNRFRKTDIISVHAVLYKIRQKLIQKGVVKESDFPDYDALNVSPMALFRQKGDHQKAVIILSSELYHAMETNDAEPIPDRPIH